MRISAPCLAAMLCGCGVALTARMNGGMEPLKGQNFDVP